MTISEQGWAAINAYEQAGIASLEARENAQCYAMKLMVDHLHTVHGFGPRKISKLMGLKYTIVMKMICPNKVSTAPREEVTQTAESFVRLDIITEPVVK